MSEKPKKLAVRVVSIVVTCPHCDRRVPDLHGPITLEDLRQVVGISGGNSITNQSVWSLRDGERSACRDCGKGVIAPDLLNIFS